jgi:hypothetical protein
MVGVAMVTVWLAAPSCVSPAAVDAADEGNGRHLDGYLQRVLVLETGDRVLTANVGHVSLGP